MVVGDPVSNDVRMDNRQFAQGRSGHRTAAIGKGLKAVACRKQFVDQPCRGARIELRDVPINIGYFSKRGRRPDYLHGGGVILPLASLRSHCRTFLCGTPFPASISASASAIARASDLPNAALWKVNCGIAEIKAKRS